LSVKTLVSRIELIISGLQNLMNGYSEQLAPYSVFLKEISKNGLTIVVEYFTGAVPVREFDELKQKISLQIKQLLEDHSIELAGEPNRIVIHSDLEAS
jgi:hypothetical protein